MKFSSRKYLSKAEYCTLSYTAPSHTSEKYFKILMLIIYTQWTFPQL
jgi:hypothetical protein